MQTFYIKRGDESSVLPVTLTDDNGAVDLDGATVLFTMRNLSKAVSGSATPDPDQTVNKGVVRYEFSPTDLDEAGDFMAEFEVTFATGQIATYPRGTSPHVLVVVQPDDAGTVLTAEQIDDVREIAQLTIYSQAQDLLTGLNNTQLVKVAAAIEEWRVIHRKHIRFRGKGVDMDFERNRQQIIREMRSMLGLPPLIFDSFLMLSGFSKIVRRW